MITLEQETEKAIVTYAKSTKEDPSVLANRVLIDYLQNERLKKSYEKYQKTGVYYKHEDVMAWGLARLQGNKKHTRPKAHKNENNMD